MTLVCYNIVMNKIIIKLSKRSSYSYSVTIPKEIIEKYGWKSKQKLTIEDKGRGKLEIKDWRKK
jgi:bifunctional DNA-binding transcriptional regulator/antitoxin component of YhaV-PrlF toxin-antitoxin module